MQNESGFERNAAVRRFAVKGMSEILSLFLCQSYFLLPNKGNPSIKGLCFLKIQV